MKVFKRVVMAERSAIAELEKDCEEKYAEILDILFLVKGKIVFMGVGKSGHIGKKLAATFASLGIPSIFVHSTEAMHGDLGMIQPADIAVLISNSGNTAEVVQNIAPLKANGVKTVAFTSNNDSALATKCDYKLIYPNLPEADALGLAPTVSSTLALVLGDAIACELSARKDFLCEDFFKYHPNGALGAKLKRQLN